MEERIFRDSPLAQDYLYYIQDSIQSGTPFSEITPPEEYYLRYMKGDPREASLAALEATDPRLDAIRRIYALLGQGGKR